MTIAAGDGVVAEAAENDVVGDSASNNVMALAGVDEALYSQTRQIDRVITFASPNSYVADARERMGIAVDTEKAARNGDDVSRGRGPNSQDAVGSAHLGLSSYGSSLFDIVAGSAIEHNICTGCDEPIV